MASASQLFQANLRGRTAAITGALGGIGTAIARRFLHEGANLVLLGRNESKLQDKLRQVVNNYASELESSNPQGVTSSPQVAIGVLDVRKEEDWMRAIPQMPDVDILVNCAGITQRSLLVRTKQESIRDILDTNLLGSINGCKHFGQHWISKRRRDCCIINISSLLAVKGSSGTTVYSASKAGMIGLTTSLAAEFLSRDIRVNAILPGYIDTAMTNASTPDGNADAATAPKMKIPVSRFGTPEEVADAAAFLAKNKYANNCILNLDGGLSAT